MHNAVRKKKLYKGKKKHFLRTLFFRAIRVFPRKGTCADFFFLVMSDVSIGFCYCCYFFLLLLLLFHAFVIFVVVVVLLHCSLLLSSYQLYFFTFFSLFFLHKNVLSNYQTYFPSHPSIHPTFIKYYLPGTVTSAKPLRVNKTDEGYAYMK